MGTRCGTCTAFPIDLLLSDEQKGDEQAMMNTRLDESNFNGAVKDRFDRFIAGL